MSATKEKSRGYESPETEEVLVTIERTILSNEGITCNPDEDTPWE